jgi:hypothetical protein
MFNRIAAYSLFVLGLLTATFFRHYSGSLIPYPWVFFVLGLVMFLAGYLLLRYSPAPKEKAALNRVRRLIADLKENGERIRVDFDTCQIRGHSYREARPSHGADSLLTTLTVGETLTSLLDHLDNAGGDGLRNVQQSVIVFQYENDRTGAKEKFISPVIAKDEISLSFYLDQQKHTTLYVDKTNRDFYYFDLGFLNA